MDLHRLILDVVGARKPTEIQLSMTARGVRVSRQAIHAWVAGTAIPSPPNLMALCLACDASYQQTEAARALATAAAFAPRVSP